MVKELEGLIIENKKLREEIEFLRKRVEELSKIKSILFSERNSDDIDIENDKKKISSGEVVVLFVELQAKLKKDEFLELLREFGIYKEVPSVRDVLRLKNREEFYKKGNKVLERGLSHF